MVEEDGSKPFFFIFIDVSNVRDDDNPNINFESLLLLSNDDDDNDFDDNNGDGDSIIIGVCILPIFVIVPNASTIISVDDDNDVIKTNASKRR